MYRKYNEVLKELRLEKGYTQKEVAEAVNITQRAYAFYEKGDRQPSIETILKLAEFYNIPTDILLGRYGVYKDESN